jgi:hypothetical protein
MILAAIVTFGGAASTAFAACTGTVMVCAEAVPGAFRLVSAGKPASVYVDADAAAPVLRVAADFAADLERVSGQPAKVINSLDGVSGDVVIVGQTGQSALIDRLVKGGALTGQWEAYSQSVVKNPAKGVERALVIAGSDPRGTVFGVYDVSAKMGVSPWYWWADVPVKRQADVSVTAGTRSDKPVVKYRGFFINDEFEVVRQGLRAEPAPEGQLSLAGHVGQGDCRRRSGKPECRQPIWRDPRHVAPRTHDARPRRMAPPQRGRHHRRQMGLSHQCRKPAPVLAWRY